MARRSEKGLRAVGDLLPQRAQEIRPDPPKKTNAAGREKNHPKKLEAAAALIAAAPAELVGQVGYFPPYLVQCTLPHSDPQSSRWERSVPWMRLVVDGDPLVPYGPVSRLFLAHVMTRAVVTQSPVIELPDSVGGLAASLGLDGSDTRTRRRLREQVSRCLDARWRAYIAGEIVAPSPELAVEMIADGVDGSKVQHVHRESWELATRWEGIISAGDPTQRTLTTPVIELDPRLWAMLQKRAAPHDMRALRALAGSSLAMDFYTWANLKLATLAKPEFFPWTWLMQQFGSDYNPSDSNSRDNFRKESLKQLRTVATVWPSLADYAEVVKGRGRGVVGGVMLRPGKPHVRLLR